MERARFITHKGKRILFVDYSNCSPEDILKTIQKSKRLMEKQPAQSLLTLTNVENAHFNSEVVETAKNISTYVRPYIKRGAIVGLSGFQKIAFIIIMTFSKRNLSLFVDLEKAKDWLVGGGERGEIPFRSETEQRDVKYSSVANEETKVRIQQNCWEYKRCGREPGGEKVEELGVCPATTDASSDGLNQGTNAGRICWAIAGTFCGGKVQGTFAQKQVSCIACDFFQKVHEEQSDKFRFLKPGQTETPHKLTKA